MSITRIEEQRRLRAHLLMMLEAMQYSGNITKKNNDELRELVEEQKLSFLRKIQDSLPAVH